MKATLLQRGTTPDHSFTVARHDFPHFLKIWHYHPELELVYTIKSEGTRFIGDNIDRFGSDELVLIGSNLPHMFQNDAKYFEQRSNLSAEAYVIHFHAQFLQADFEDIPEFRTLSALFKDAGLGIKFSSDTTRAVREKIQNLNRLKGISSMLHFLELLGNLAEDDYETIASPGFVNRFEDVTDQRLGTVYDHVMNHFQEEVSVDKAAELVGMNVSSFCRYFKRMTQKTFTEFLNEVRIGFACKLLLEKKMSVLEISYECGYNNISHFNRQFLKRMKMSPTAYRKSRASR